MKWHSLPVFVCGLLLMMGTANADDNAVDEQANPLTGSEKLIGGRWQLDNSYQTFEWGVGKQSVVSRSYTQT
ncbi:MAG: hypothetical protein ACR2QU_06980, partial [Gammaproteobacteria bacterium]